MAAGVTVTDVPETFPTPEPMAMPGAGMPVTTQCKVVDCPTVIVAGLAVKLAMAGTVPAVNVTCDVAVPTALVAVSV